MKAPRNPKRPVLPPSLLAQILLPFAIPVAITLALLLAVGEGWPRNIAPGSGLKLTGLIATALCGMAAWRWATRQVADGRVRRFAAILITITALMGWPVWAVGALPSLNGSSLGTPRQTDVQLVRLDITMPSRGHSGFYHWAWIAPRRATSPIGAGRVFIPEEAYRKWNAQRPATVTLRHANGLLGAEVLTGFD
ncbi:MAG: hypothetical protein ACOVQ0_14780 [Novosphingobium sp.]|uniref:hypothetical protein n=1 Tax=Novosphingobium sp. TaxID=1874826 RepID=UPI003B9C88B7